MGSTHRPLTWTAGSRRNRRRQRAPRSSARLMIAPIRGPGHRATWARAGVQDQGPVHLAAPEGATISIRLSKTASPSVSRGARPPADRSLLRPAGATQPTCSAFTVSHRPDGSRHLSLASMLQPATDHEVRRVSAFHDPCAHGPSRLSHQRHTLQSLSLSASLPRVTAGTCPLVVRHPAGSTRPQGLEPTSSPLRIPSCEGGARPMLSWASRLGAPACARGHLLR